LCFSNSLVKKLFQVHRLISSYCIL